MMATVKKIALVTGANKGIGLEICRQLAQQSMTVWLAARSLAAGEQAAQVLRDEGLDVFALRIEMDDATSFDAAFDLIAQQYGHLDVLVNNAGFANDWSFTAADVPMQMLRETFDTNFFAQVALTQKFLPLLKQSTAGRIVNQSSALGSLTLHSTPEAKMGDLKPFAYDSSKTALNAFTVHLAHALRDTKIKVNSAHPGAVLTDANPYGTLSVADGARTAVLLATLPDDGPNGQFFHLEHALPW